MEKLFLSGMAKSVRLIQFELPPHNALFFQAQSTGNNVASALRADFEPQARPNNKSKLSA
jgi:hypothetical protein